MTLSLIAIDSGQTGIKVAVKPNAANHNDTDPTLAKSAELNIPRNVKTKAASQGDTGATVHHWEIGNSELSYPGIRTNSPLFPQLISAISQVVNAAQLTKSQVHIGTTGLTAIENDPAVLLRECAAFGVEKVILAHDSVTAFLGAMGYQQGVVVAAGTGVVTLGVGPKQVTRVDGWGNIIGDAGSGYWVGREALDAAMRSYDGRSPKTLLQDAMQEEFPNLEDAYIELQSDPDRVRRVASFTPAVVSLAASDKAAADICQRAGEELAHSAITAAQNAAIATTVPQISLIGGIFQAAPIRESCIAALRNYWLDFEPYTPLGNGLSGALALADIPASHPLHSRIAIAE